ncbi:SH3 domain-containing protein [Nakamurella sp. GG22]
MHAVADVNVRDAPGTDGTTVISTLDSGAAVTAGETVDGWVPVKTGETLGWVSADFLADGDAPAAADEPPAPEAAASQENAPAPPQASSGNWMTDLLPEVDPGGAAQWEFWRNGGWGATDGHTVYIDPDVPADKRFSVMIHEYSHVLQVQVYGSIDASAAAMGAISGMSATAANESTADCMALMQGATWVDYGCQDSLRGAAEAVLAGHRP